MWETLHDCLDVRNSSDFAAVQRKLACLELVHELTILAKIVKHNPLNCIVRQKFDVVKKVYKRLLKQREKEKKYVSSIKTQLSLAFSKDPTSFWQAIKTLKNDNISDCPPSVSTGQFYLVRLFF